MILTDSARQSELRGEYGFYNELTDSAFVTGNATLRWNIPRLILFICTETRSRHTCLRIRRKSPTYTVVYVSSATTFRGFATRSARSRDSILYMYYHPIIWNGDNQIAGNVVYLHFNDSTADWARLPESGLVAQHVGEDCYNQLAGADMTAWFNDSTIRRLYVEGQRAANNVPMENDSTYNKFVFHREQLYGRIFSMAMT